MALLVAVLSLVTCAAAVQAHRAAPLSARERLRPGPATMQAERLLRVEESVSLGTEHAAEHARLRVYRRDPRWRHALQ
nr:hypothetical protein [Thermoleophilaceae bacterium]